LWSPTHPVRHGHSAPDFLFCRIFDNFERQWTSDVEPIYRIAMIPTRTLPSILLAAFLGTALHAQQTVTSVMNGMATNPLTWDCICLPAAGDTIIIQHDVALNIDYGVMGGALRVDPVGSLVEIGARGLSVSGSGQLEIFGYFEVSAVLIGAGSSATNGGTVMSDQGWSIHGSMVSNGSMYGLDSLLITIDGELQANDTVQAGAVANLGGLTGISPVYQFNRMYNAGLMELFGGSLTVAGDMLNAGDLSLNNANVSIGDDFGNMSDMTLSGFMNVGDNFYNADTTGLLTPTLTLSGAIHTRDWYNEGQISGTGRFCVQDTTINLGGSVQGTVDLCDQSPTVAVPPFVDLNTGSFGSGVTFCAVGACTVGVPDGPRMGTLTLRRTDADHLLVMIERGRLQDIHLVDPAGRVLPTAYQPMDAGVVIGLGSLRAGAYSVRCIYRDGSVAVGRFVLAR
jgi:hypothetical protein